MHNQNANAKTEQVPTGTFDGGEKIPAGTFH